MNIDNLLEAHNLLKERAEELCRVTAIGDERFLEALAASSRVDRVLRAIEAELREVFFPAIEDRIFDLFSDGVLATFENEEGRRYIINREKNEGWRSGGSAPWLIYPDGRRERAGVLSDLAVKLARLGLRPARTAETIRTEIAKLEGQLAELSGEGLLLWDERTEEARDAPAGGAILHVQWAVGGSYDKWFPSVEGAKAELLTLARYNGTIPDLDGFHVDLTAPGCQTSRAWIERH